MAWNMIRNLYWVDGIRGQVCAAPPALGKMGREEDLGYAAPALTSLCRNLCAEGKFLQRDALQRTFGSSLFVSRTALCAFGC